LALLQVSSSWCSCSTAIKGRRTIIGRSARTSWSRRSVVNCTATTRLRRGLRKDHWSIERNFISTSPAAVAVLESFDLHHDFFFSAQLKAIRYALAAAINALGQNV